MESNSDKYERLLSESSSNKEDFHDEWTVINIVENDTFMCLCGKNHNNNVYYKLLNKINKNTLYTSFICLSKHLPELKHFATILCKQYTYHKKSGNKRMCHGCFKYVLGEDKPLWQVTCKTCYSNNIKPEPIPLLNHRVCSVCCIPNIDNSKPEYVDKCSICFKNTKVDISTVNPEKLRNCSVCNKLNILIIKPDYIDKCDECYKQNQSEKRQCKRCNKFNIAMNAPKYVDKCTPCFIASKEEEKNGPMRECIVCQKLNVPESKPKYVTKCEECFKNTKEKIFVSEIPDINFDDVTTNNTFNTLTSMMSKLKS